MNAHRISETTASALSYLASLVAQVAGRRNSSPCPRRRVSRGEASAGGEPRLAEATAEMDDRHPTWRIEDIEAARAKVSDEENGMLVVRETVRLLPQGWPPKDNEFPGPNDDMPPNKRLDLDKRNRLHVALEEWASARSEARKLASYPRGRGQLTYERNPLATLLPHVQDARTVLFLLTFEARVRIEEGDLRAAALLCRAAH